MRESSGSDFNVPLICNNYGGRLLFVSSLLFFPMLSLFDNLLPLSIRSESWIGRSLLVRFGCHPFDSWGTWVWYLGVFRTLDCHGQSSREEFRIDPFWISTVPILRGSLYLSSPWALWPSEWVRISYPLKFLLSFPFKVLPWHVGQISFFYPP